MKEGKEERGGTRGTEERRRRRATNGDGVEQEIKHVVGLNGSFPIGFKDEEQVSSCNLEQKRWRGKEGKGGRERRSSHVVSGHFLPADLSGLLNSSLH